MTPRENWIEAYQKQGFSAEAAEAYARMTAAALDRPQTAEQGERGHITLEDYIRALAA